MQCNKKIDPRKLLLFAGAAYVFFMSLLTGCHHSDVITESTNVIVYPGQGVPGVFEIGMTVAQIKKQNSGAVKFDMENEYSPFWKRVASRGRSRFILVPSLGAVAAVDPKLPVALIEFHVRLFRAPLIPSLEVTNPFRGRVGDKLSFKDGPVSKKAVEAIYGKVDRVANHPTEALEFRRRGESFIHHQVEGVDELWYAQHGVAFVLQSNIVTSFKIFKATSNNFGYL